MRDRGDHRQWRYRTRRSTTNQIQLNVVWINASREILEWRLCIHWVIELNQSINFTILPSRRWHCVSLQPISARTRWLPNHYRSLPTAARPTPLRKTCALASATKRTQQMAQEETTAQHKSNNHWNELLCKRTKTALRATMLSAVSILLVSHHILNTKKI